MSVSASNDTLAPEPVRRARLPVARGAARELLRLPSAIVSLAILVVLAVCAIAPALVAPYDPYQQDLAQRFLAPSAEHLFGTDDFGRDIFSRVIFGTRISLLTAVAVVTASVTFGCVVGTVAAYRGRWTDELLMRTCDVFMAFPSILLPMIIVVVLGPSLVNTAIALSVRGWAPFARLMRGQVLAVKDLAYVDAARVLGANDRRIVRRYIWPNAIAPIIVLAAIDVGFVILTAAGLGFLGLGAQPPTPEWGVMVAAGLQNLLIAWWYPVFSGLAIATAVLAFSLLGDALQDWLDPKKSNR